MIEWYFEVGLGKRDQQGYQERLQRVFSAIHRAIKLEYEGMVGISFPQWEAGQKQTGGSLGEKLYVICVDDHALRRVLHRLQAETERPSLTCIKRVPEGAHRFIFCRSRQHQRYFHHQKHGDTQGRKAASERLKALGQVPSVKVQSKSTKQSFRMAIDCRPESEATDVTLFNSYGLSSGLSVPVF